MTQSKLATVEILNNKSLRHEGGLPNRWSVRNTPPFPTSLRHRVSGTDRKTKQTNRNKQKRNKNRFLFLFFYFSHQRPIFNSFAIRNTTLDILTFSFLFCFFTRRRRKSGNHDRDWLIKCRVVGACRIILIVGGLCDMRSKSSIFPLANDVREKKRKIFFWNCLLSSQNADR